MQLPQVREKQDEGIDIENILADKISMVLRNAIENVPYYRSLKLNIKPAEINKDNAKEALKIFPYLEKKTIMDNPDAFISNLYNKNRLDHLTGPLSRSRGRLPATDKGCD